MKAAFWSLVGGVALLGGFWMVMSSDAPRWADGLAIMITGTGLLINTMVESESKDVIKEIGKARRREM